MIYPPHLGDGDGDRAQPQSPRGQLSGGASARFFSTEAFSGRDRHPHHRWLARGDGTRLFSLAIELTKTTRRFSKCSAVVVFSYLFQSDGALMTQLLFARDEVIVARVLKIVINVYSIRPY